MTDRLASRAAGPLAALLLAAALAGCATTVPLQTASTVPTGVVRISGQVTSSVWCSFSADYKNCAYAPSDGLGVPELRLAGRVGVHDQVDLGLTAFATPVLGSGVRWGGLFDAKAELWRAEVAPGRKQVVSAGLGLGLTRMEDTSQSMADHSYLQMDVVLPVRYGYQFEFAELFVGPHWIERLSFDPPGSSGVVEVPWLGLSVGFITRSRAKFGLALSYEAPLRYMGDGAFNVTVGFLYDVGGKPDRDARVREPQVPAAVQTGIEP